METGLEKSSPGNIVISLEGRENITLPRGAKALDILPSYKTRTLPALGVRINNVVKDLNSPLSSNNHLQFIDYTGEDGRRIYEHSLIMVLGRAASEVLPGCSINVLHTLSNGVYGDLNLNRATNERYINLIEERMREIVAADEPIDKKIMSKDGAINLFLAIGQEKKVGLLKYCHKSQVEIYNCGWYHDFSYEPMVPRTGLLQTFRLRFYMPGFILELPRKDDPLTLPEYIEQGKLAEIYFETKKWRDTMGVHDVVSLNKNIENGKTSEMIRVAEAFHEKKISRIADLITQSIDRIRLVTISGPSSSSKSTFIQRLATQLRVNGINPVFISLDNYFVSRDKTPRDETGQYDFESIDAIDRALFNEHLTKLLQGEEVELPYFNFKLGQRQYRGDVLKIDEKDLIMIEGIHGLNDKLTSSIPLYRKFKIYISALTSLNLDIHKRIHASDLRLVRRIVRDNQHRAKNALDTIKMWPSVRRGEERNIFPFQENADVMFNSATAYDLAALKNYAVPLLEEVTPDCPEYSETQRLLHLLDFFLPLPDKEVPANSLLREFIGDSCYLD